MNILMLTEIEAAAGSREHRASPALFFRLSRGVFDEDTSRFDAEVGTGGESLGEAGTSVLRHRAAAVSSEDPALVLRRGAV